MKPVQTVIDLLAPDPLDPADIVSGNPEAFDLTLATDGDGGTCGLWMLTPGVVTDTELEEKSLVMDGSVTIDFGDGRVEKFGTGDLIEFSGGEKTTWTVHETLFKSYWIKKAD